MCVDSLSLFELRVSGGCVACVRACVCPGRRLCGACAHAYGRKAFMRVCM